MCLLQLYVLGWLFLSIASNRRDSEYWARCFQFKSSNTIIRNTRMEHVRNNHPIRMPQYIHARIADVYRTNLSCMCKPVLHGIPSDWTMLLSSVYCATQFVSCWIRFVLWNILLVVKHLRSAQYFNELDSCSLGVILMGHISRQIQNLEENIKTLKPYRTVQRGSILIFWAMCRDSIPFHTTKLVPTSG